MTSWVVCDSGILLATVLPETYSTQALALLHQWEQKDIRLAAPALLRYEVVSVIRKSVYRNILPVDDAVQKRDILLAQPVRIYLDDTLLRRAYDLATQYNLPATYDAQYLAVAERLECELWTADERLYNALRPSINTVKWLGQYNP